MVGAPDFNVSALARYEWPAWGGTLAVQTSGSYQQEIWYDIQNHPISKENGYTVVNFRTSYTTGDEAPGTLCLRQQCLRRGVQELHLRLHRPVRLQPAGRRPAALVGCGCPLQVLG
jgi:hypothetical protein